MDDPAVHTAFEATRTWMLRNACSPAPPAQVPFATNEKAAGAAQVAFVKASTVGFEHEVATEHALQVPHVRSALSSTVNALTNGVDDGQGTLPGEVMQAEKPAGGFPAQTAWALAGGTSQ